MYIVWQVHLSWVFILLHHLTIYNCLDTFESAIYYQPEISQIVYKESPIIGDKFAKVYLKINGMPRMSLNFEKIQRPSIFKNTTVMSLFGTTTLRSSFFGFHRHRISRKRGLLERKCFLLKRK